MGLAEKIQADLREAMKARDERRTSTLRLIRARLLEKEAEKAGVQLTDEIVLKILEGMVKQYRDSIAEYEKAGRADVADAERAEMEIVQAYLPAEMTEAEISAVVTEVIAQTGASGPGSVGRVMGAAMQRLKQAGKRVDGAKVKQIVSQKLNA
ncbi:MAG: GatB/YqeY domain-containing protein [Candidatus Sumerlaeia bacterium]